MFEIRVSSRLRCIHSTLAGFLTPAEVGDYVRGMEAAHARWFRHKPPYRLIIDALDARIQSQEVLALLAAHIASFPKAERVGLAVDRSLSRYQALRLMDRPHVRIADDFAEARSWALEDAVVAPADFELVVSSPPPELRARA